MTQEEQQQFNELQLRCSKTKYRIDYIPAKEDGDRYWEFYSVDEKGYEYGRENFFSIQQLIETVEDYLDIEDTEDINDMGINDYGTFDFIEE
jgi:hypothetical protein